MELLCLCAGGLGAGATAVVCLRHRAPPPDLLGVAGARRAAALQSLPGLRLLEPPVRTLGAWLAAAMPSTWKTALQTRLRGAGYPLGLGAGELVGLVLLLSVLGLALGAAAAPMAARSTGLSTWAPVVGALLLGALPLQRVDALCKQRRRDVDRELPIAIDLVAMAMNAGLDFAAALHHVTDPERNRGTLGEELSQVLDALRLGETRRQALQAFAGRVSTPSVRQLVAAIIQAQEAGNPLAAVLRTQATALRARRSVLAEEAASRAALMLTLPMMMMLCCVLLLLMGPAVLRSVTP